METTTDGVYLITGAAGGAAGPIAEVFRSAGATLALADLSEPALAERAQALDARAFSADLRRSSEADRLIAQVQGAYGRIDGVIHTVGAFDVATAQDSGDDLYDRQLDLNLRTLVNVTRAVLPVFLTQRAGFLAGFSTRVVWSGSGSPRMSLYAAAKAAATFYLRSIDRELRSAGVRVAIVYPMNSIDTPANRAAEPDADPTNWIDAADIGRALLFAATRPPRGRIVELPIG